MEMALWAVAFVIIIIICDNQIKAGASETKGGYHIMMMDCNCKNAWGEMCEKGGEYMQVGVIPYMMSHYLSVLALCNASHHVALLLAFSRPNYFCVFFTCLLG